MSRVKVDQVFPLLRIGNNITSTWPNNLDDGKFIFILREIKWCLSIPIVIFILVGTIINVRNELNDLVITMTIVTQIIAITEGLLNLLLCKLLSTRLQVHFL